MSREERMSRAGDYVLGLMNDHERQRAERDMEVDAEFRDCVLRLAERFRVFEHGRENGKRDEMWASVEARLAALPQMRTGAPAPHIAAAAGAAPVKAAGLRAVLQQIDPWRAAVIAACMVAAWALGFLAGRASAPLPQPDAVSGQAVHPPR